MSGTNCGSTRESLGDKSKRVTTLNKGSRGVTGKSIIDGIYRKVLVKTAIKARA